MYTDTDRERKRERESDGQIERERERREREREREGGSFCQTILSILPKNGLQHCLAVIHPVPGRARPV